MFEARKYNRWQRSTASSTSEPHKAPVVETWSEADTRARMYHGSHNDLARNR